MDLLFPTYQFTLLCAWHIVAVLIPKDEVNSVIFTASYCHPNFHGAASQDVHHLSLPPFLFLALMAVHPHIILTMKTRQSELLVTGFFVCVRHKNAEMGRTVVQIFFWGILKGKRV